MSPPGSLKALAVTRPVRSPFAPAIPTVSESGIPGFDVNAWVCLMTTGGTPAPIIARLNAEVRKAMALPEVRDSFAKQGLEAIDHVAGRAWGLHQIRIRSNGPMCSTTQR